MNEDDDVAAELLLGGVSRAGLPGSVVGRAHRINRGLHHHAVQPELVAEMVVDRGNVGARGAANLAHGHFLEAAIGEQPLGRLDQPVPGLAIRRAHNVRLKSIVAAPIATMENIIRNPRS